MFKPVTLSSYIITNITLSKLLKSSIDRERVWGVSGKLSLKNVKIVCMPSLISYTLYFITGAKRFQHKS